jgi:3D (Asp-Asp-Asp) domain-containing protein/peptidoglycan hydrolase CwlO-like protein
VRGRIFGLGLACAVMLVVPAVPSAAPIPSVEKLDAQQHSIEQQKRSAVLSLYSLDSRLAASQHRLDVLRSEEASLRAERASLETQLHIARTGTHATQRRLAQRLRALYDHGGTSAVDVVFGARSLSDALDALDNFDHVTSLDSQILTQLRSAEVRVSRTKRELAARETALRSAIRSAAAETRSLAAVRTERSAYIAHLTYRQAQITSLDAQARAAEVRTHRLLRTPAAAVVARIVPAQSGNGLTVVSTGYCLSGRTATGIPVGWGVAAVDPSVIPLGTRLSIPGYGEAVAADTGGSIVGDRIDLWFPSCGQAGGWGSRSVTIALH